MTTQEKIDAKENLKEKIEEDMKKAYLKTDKLRKEMGVLNAQLSELYTKLKHERKAKAARD